MQQVHIPVLAKEVLEGLHLQPNNTVIDATLGLGGHAGMILEAIGPNGVLYGFDRDERNIAIAKQNLSQFGERFRSIHDSFANIDAHIQEPIQAALYDLGFSSAHVDDAQRGFSFQKDGPLDMRYDRSGSLTAEEVVNSFSKEELATIFRKFGEEPASEVVAKAIFGARRQERITTTLQLANIVSSVLRRRGKAHPATRVFQALRIVVNDEFGELQKSIPQIVSLLKTGGRLGIITFHSLEDRVVKEIMRDFKEMKRIGKPNRPEYAERKSNPRSRSAKLRIYEKL